MEALSDLFPNSSRVWSSEHLQRQHTRHSFSMDFFSPSACSRQCTEGPTAGVRGAWGRCDHPVLVPPPGHQQPPEEVLVPPRAPGGGLPHRRVHQPLHTPALPWPRGPRRLPPKRLVCGEAVPAVPGGRGALPLRPRELKQRTVLQHEPDGLSRSGPAAGGAGVVTRMLGRGGDHGKPRGPGGHNTQGQ